MHKITLPMDEEIKINKKSFSFIEYENYEPDFVKNIFSLYQICNPHPNECKNVVIFL